MGLMFIMFPLRLLHRISYFSTPAAGVEKYEIIFPPKRPKRPGGAEFESYLVLVSAVTGWWAVTAVRVH